MSDKFYITTICILYIICIFLSIALFGGNTNENVVEDTDQNKIIYEITKHEYCYELEGKWLCYDEKK